MSESKNENTRGLLQRLWKSWLFRGVVLAVITAIIAIIVDAVTALDILAAIGAVFRWLGSVLATSVALWVAVVAFFVGAGLAVGIGALYYRAATREEWPNEIIDECDEHWFRWSFTRNDTGSWQIANWTAICGGCHTTLINSRVSSSVQFEVSSAYCPNPNCARTYAQLSGEMILGAQNVCVQRFRNGQYKSRRVRGGVDIQG